MDPARTPVILAAGHSIEREEIVDAIELATRASQDALGAARGLRDKIGRLTMVSVVFSGRSLPEIQWIGASKWVPVCSPQEKLFQYQAGPLSS